MDLKQFAETYSNLNNKALEILRIHGLGDYNLEAISVEDYNGKLLFNIEACTHYRGCDPESAYLVFDLEEMNNDTKYFETKYKDEVEKEEAAKRLEKENEDRDRRLRKEAKDKLEYERLKLKYESQ